MYLNVKTQRLRACYLCKYLAEYLNNFPTKNHCSAHPRMTKRTILIPLVALQVAPNFYM